MALTMGRGAYAFRDLDEELHAFVSDDNVPYEPHWSPPDAKSKSAKSKRNLNGLSESSMLKMYVDHHKAQRRRKLLGGVLFVGVAALAIAPMVFDLQSSESELELALSAPYRSIRVRGEKDPKYDPLARVDDDDQWISQEPNVGDVDPHDPDVNELNISLIGAFDAKPSAPAVQAPVEDEDDGDDERVENDAPLANQGRENTDPFVRQTLTDTKRFRAEAMDDDEN